MTSFAPVKEDGLLPLAEGVWTISFPNFTAGGIQFGTRSTVVALDEGLWLHSPGPFTAQQFDQLESYGKVVAVVAPNMMHHLFLEKATQRFPEANVYLAPGLIQKCPHLPAGETLGHEPPPLWSGHLEQLRVEGMPKLNETVFYHRSSRTLIATDLAFNFRHCPHLPTRMVMRCNGVLGRLAPSRLLRYYFTGDKNALRKSMQEILEWPFETMVLAHGEIAQSQAREQLRQGYSWLLGSGGV